MSYQLHVSAAHWTGDSFNPGVQWTPSRYGNQPHLDRGCTKELFSPNYYGDQSSVRSV